MAIEAMTIIAEYSFGVVLELVPGDIVASRFPLSRQTAALRVAFFADNQHRGNLHRLTEGQNYDSEVFGWEQDGRRLGVFER
jgi:hypothetical protein